MPHYAPFFLPAQSFLRYNPGIIDQNVKYAVVRAYDPGGSLYAGGIEEIDSYEPDVAARVAQRGRRMLAQRGIARAKPHAQSRCGELPRDLESDALVGSCDECGADWI